MYKNLNYSAKLVSFTSRKRKRDLVRLFEQFGGNREFSTDWNGYDENDYFQGKYSLSHISNVLAGRRENKEIVNAAYRLSYRRVKNIDLI